MRFRRTEEFNTAWQTLSERQKLLAGKAINNLIRDIRYPGLRVKKIRGARYLWEARVSYKLRMTFQLEADVIILRNIGHHDETLKNP